ncbi:MAG: DNA polymerase III subunit delta [Actinobacteria bacterium]|nr:DNA polymerase III subunit delta [Actinomycetota bacterium]
MAAEATSAPDSKGGRKVSAARDSQAASAGKGPLKAAYLILGDDEPKVEKALRRLKMRIGQAASGDVGDLNIVEFWATAGTSVGVVNAANTMAFLGGLRLVLVHSVHMWKKEDKDRVVAYLRSPAPDACLALVGDKLPAADSLRAAVAATGDVLEYAAPRRAKFTDWVTKQAARLRMELGQEEARLLVERMGEHQHLVLRELEKLSVYAGPGRITTDDIEAVCSHTLEASVFELVDALAAGQGVQAFRALEELYAAGEEPMSLFYRVLWHFEKLVAVIALRSGGGTFEQTQDRLKLKAFPAKKLWRQSNSLRPERARMIVQALSRADARMKGMSPLPSEVAAGLEFELCLGAILTACRA